MKNTLILLVALFIISCSKSDDEQTNSTKVEITSFSSKKVRIGDTLIIKGKNLDIVTEFSFTNGNERIAREPLEKSKDLLKAIIPTLNYEKIELNLAGSRLEPIMLDLVGTFPLRYNTNDYILKNENISGVKMVSEKVAFLTSRNKLYKTTDGGYNWQMIREFNGNIGSKICFLDENTGWIGVYTNRFILFYTEDGGQTFNQVFDEVFHYSSIMGIYFSTPKNGYLISTAGEVYHTNDNSNFDLIYNSSTSPAGKDFNFNRFSFYNDNLIAAGENSSNGKSILLQRVNNVFNYSILDTWTWAVQLLNESEAYYSNNVDNNYMYKENVFYTNDIASSNWERAGDQYIRSFHFINKDKGIGTNLEYDTPQGHSVIYETYDGGKNWINKYKFNNFEFGGAIDFYNNHGLITGNQGLIWKHILE